MKVHNLLKGLRKKSGVKQYELADLVGAERSTWTRKEAGKILLSAEELVQAVRHLRPRIDDQAWAEFLDAVFEHGGETVVKDKYINLLEDQIKLLRAQVEHLQNTGVEAPRTKKG